MMVIPFAGTAVIGAILVLVWARVTRTPWREIGFVAPSSWVRALVLGVPFGAAFKFAMKALVMPLFGVDPVNRAYHYLAGNAPAAAFMAVFVVVSGGFAEETVYRGFFFERFCKLFGTRAGAVAKPLTLVLTSLVCRCALPGSGPDGRRTSPCHRAGVWHDFRGDAKPRGPDAGARGLRLGCHWHDLLGP